MTLQTLTNKCIAYLENAPIPYSNYIVTFLAAITLRNFLECFSQSLITNYLELPSHQLLNSLIHFNLFYLTVVLLIIIALHIATHTDIQKIAKVILPGSIIIVCVPLVDMILSGGPGYFMNYLQPSNDATHHSLLYYFLTYYRDYAGISWGQRLEIIFILFGVFYYVRTKQKSITRSFITSLFCYTIIFFTAITPYIIDRFFRIINLNISQSITIFINYYLIILLPISIWFAFLINKNIFKALIKDLRWLRIGHFELMFFLGIVLTKNYCHLNFISSLFLAIAIIFFSLFSIITNNIVDIAIDKISNQTRPLVQNVITVPTYKTIAYVALVMCFIYAIATNWLAFLGIVICIFSYYCYSMPPLRLKRIPLFSKTIIAFVSLMFVLIGYYIAGGALHNFPKNLGLIILIGYTFAANFIDIKDYAGDKANHILTLPVLLGEKTAKLFIGITFLLTTISFHFYLNNWYLFPWLIICGGLGFYFINQQTYQEWKVFSVYLISTTFLICYILITTLCK
jgi:homogentisate phytyltransferase / homogentisate geranylgeranyltransferase